MIKLITNLISWLTEQLNSTPEWNIKREELYENGITEVPQRFHQDYLSFFFSGEDLDSPFLVLRPFFLLSSHDDARKTLSYFYYRSISI